MKEIFGVALLPNGVSCAESGFGSFRGSEKPKAVNFMNTLNAGFISKLRVLVVSGFCLCICLGAVTEALAVDGGGLSDSVRAQIQALQSEKAALTPTQQKLDSQLWFAVKLSRHQSIANGAVPQLRVRAQPGPDGRILVDIKANVMAELLKQIEDYGGTVVNSFAQFNAIRSWLPISQVENLAGSTNVTFIHPAMEAMRNIGSLDTEGNVTHRADTARSNFRVDGTGVKVGVLSDSVDFLARSQASGDLGPVTILPGQSGVPGSGEGTAMLEIIHDLAPGADLFFASAFSSEAGFAQNILNLRAAGCDIIVDDVGYFDESPFQDGIVAQAVNTVTASGALYFSSAANSGNLSSGTSGTWQGDFVDGGAVGAPITGKGGNVHSFGSQTYDTVTGSGFASVLFWADPLGAATNDYDLYVLDSTGANVVSSSITVQNGFQDPYEIVFPPNVGERLVIVKASGAPRFLHLDTIRGKLAIGTEGNTKGHSAAIDAFSVAAVDVATSFPNPFIGGAVNPVESFSSDGPRRVFYTANGTPITPGNFSATGGTVRQKPDIAAADGVKTAVPGFNPFFGTSAAAPHAAAIAALLKSFNPDLLPGQIRTILTNTALNVMANGIDRDSGSGVVMAFPALLATPLSTPTPRLILVTNIITGGNGNGIIDYNECNNLDLILTNIGSADATSVHVILTSTTPGVTIAQRAALYSDIAIGGSGTNLTSFRISTSPTFICGTSIDFLLIIKSSQVTTTNFFKISGSNVGLPVRFDNQEVIAIPDANPIGTNSSIVVSNISSAILKLTVSLHITHPFVPDLALQLIGPDGTRINLSRNHGSGPDYGIDCASDTSRTVFSDDASNSIALAFAPFTGTFKPEESLSAFAGKSGSGVNGTWKLNVVDGAPLGVGAIQCWSLIIVPATCADGGGQCPGTDLAIGMKATPDPVTVGSNLVYAITVTNFGPDTAKSVVMNQSLPPSVLFVSATSSQGSISHSGNSVSCNLGNLNVGATAQITVIGIPTAVGSISSTASIGGSQSEIDPSNNTVTISTLVNPPSADMAVTMLANPNPVANGSTLTYSIFVTNNGPSFASGVLLTNVLPASVIFNSASLSQGSSINFGNTVICNLGTLPPAGTASVSISVTPTVLGSLTATATVTANQADPVPANNTAQATATVSPSADLGITLIAPTSVILNSNFLYGIIVTNYGPNTASSVVINDNLPAGLGFVSASTSQGTTNVAGNFVSFNLGSLPGGASVTATIVVAATNIGNFNNTVSVTSGQGDPNTANNTATLRTRVASPFTNIVAAGSKLISESQAPANGAINIGETVTLSLLLQNNGNVSNANLTATLLATGGVTAPSSPQIYGALTPGGFPAVARPFTFTASGTNGGTITATLQLQDGATTLPPAKFTFSLPTLGTFANTNTIVINDSGAASPYPSTNLVSGISGIVGKVAVILTNMNHTYSDDVDILLVSPTGQKILLMSDAGGGSLLSGISLTFDDTSDLFLPQASQIFSGTYKPSPYGTVAFPTNAPVAPYDTSLSVLNGSNPNGTWSLYVMDDSAGDAGSIVGGWSLAITTINPVNQIADLSVTGSSVPNPVFVTGNLTNTFTINNNGPDTATSVVLTNALPGNATFISANLSQGSYFVVGGNLVSSLGNLPAGSNATITVVIVPTAAGSVTSTANISSFENDLNLSNNSVTLLSTANPTIADVAVAVQAAPSPAVVGNNLTYTVTVNNNGPGTALNVVVTDPLPAGLTFISATPSIGSSINSSGTVTWNLGNLPVGVVATMAIIVNPSQP
ncbi:MAG: hypothetical protein JWQ71_4887, partial [Pedosphaera sp.]|nr:hypothetical protein [Pedosphaera sp.]